MIDAQVKAYAYLCERMTPVAFFFDHTAIPSHDVSKVIMRTCVRQSFVPVIESHPEYGIVYHTLIGPECVWRKGVAELFVGLAGNGKQDVYFIQVKHDGPIKIGISDNVHGRLARLETANPYDLHLIGTIFGGGRAAESRLHKRFSSLHIKGEWFRPDQELLYFISQHAQGRDHGKT